ncbi:hypothetical protein [Phreatobacter stygius]|uniref:Uncharacterized protein n=1 Tax=Phreatobacter stygius TaxID=1940610 RepID=A0A4D7ATE5_9HYPH|nr:hypothetical protein [Phreatobacter stygius]QCI64814.1 hypothetical protein E8M01_11615 [Phreatobacter stygius]
MARARTKASAEDLLGEDWFRATNAARASERARFKVWLDAIRGKIRAALDDPSDPVARADLEASLDLAAATLARLDAQSETEANSRLHAVMSAIQRVTGR